MGQTEMRRIAELIASSLRAAHPAIGANGAVNRASATVDPKALKVAQDSVHELLSAFPLYPELVFPEPLMSPEATTM
jgi:glycine/serine hydroxymethyltransferase